MTTDQATAHTSEWTPIIKLHMIHNRTQQDKTKEEHKQSVDKAAQT